MDWLRIGTRLTTEVLIPLLRGDQRVLDRRVRDILPDPLRSRVELRAARRAIREAKR